MTGPAHLKPARSPVACVEPGQWVPTRTVRFSIWLHAFAILTLIACPQWWQWTLAALLGNHLLLGAFGMSPRSKLLGPTLAALPRHSGENGFVALTFDDGPDPYVTPLVLDLLDLHKAKASFFCIGQRAIAHPEIVQDIIRRGHSVENHSYRHSNAFALYLPASLTREIAEAQSVIKSITGRTPLFFRAPMGLRSPLLDPVLARSALRSVSWTRRGLDSVCGRPATVLRRLTRRLAGGDVILLHDGSCARTRDGDPVVLAVLPVLLEHLAGRGLRPVSLPIALAGA
jgi:peptidoglycan/xylan/chitin deacetylase (PgdA/CDA1 family)